MVDKTDIYQFLFTQEYKGSFSDLENYFKESQLKINNLQETAKNKQYQFTAESTQKQSILDLKTNGLLGNSQFTCNVRVDWNKIKDDSDEESDDDNVEPVEPQIDLTRNFSQTSSNSFSDSNNSPYPRNFKNYPQDKEEILNFINNSGDHIFFNIVLFNVDFNATEQDLIEKFKQVNIYRFNEAGKGKFSVNLDKKNALQFLSLPPVKINQRQVRLDLKKCYFDFKLKQSIEKFLTNSKKDEFQLKTYLLDQGSLQQYYSDIKFIEIKSDPKLGEQYLLVRVSKQDALKIFQQNFNETQEYLICEITLSQQQNFQHGNFHGGAHGGGNNYKQKNNNRDRDRDRDNYDNYDDDHYNQKSNKVPYQQYNPQYDEEQLKNSGSQIPQIQMNQQRLQKLSSGGNNENNERNYKNDKFSNSSKSTGEYQKREFTNSRKQEQNDIVIQRREVNEADQQKNTSNFGDLKPLTKSNSYSHPKDDYKNEQNNQTFEPSPLLEVQKEDNKTQETVNVQPKTENVESVVQSSVSEETPSAKIQENQDLKQNKNTDSYQSNNNNEDRYAQKNNNQKKPPQQKKLYVKRDEEIVYQIKNTNNSNGNSENNQQKVQESVKQEIQSPYSPQQKVEKNQNSTENKRENSPNNQTNQQSRGNRKREYREKPQNQSGSQVNQNQDVPNESSSNQKKNFKSDNRQNSNNQDGGKFQQNQKYQDDNNKNASRSHKNQDDLGQEIYVRKQNKHIPLNEDQGHSDGDHTHDKRGHHDERKQQDYHNKDDKREGQQKQNNKGGQQDQKQQNINEEDQNFQQSYLEQAVNQYQGNNFQKNKNSEATNKKNNATVNPFQLLN